jgi:uncharacterized protein
MSRARIALPEDVVADFCRSHHIHRLSVFGSVLRDDFGPDSDVDVLVEFEPGHCVGLITLARMQNELSDLIGYRVDLTTPAGLSPYFRDEALAEAETQYVAA